MPIFPSFLKIDLSDIPAIFGGISLGPIAGLVIVIIKNFLQGITASTTGGVGEFANIMIGGSYVLIICLVSRMFKNAKGVFIGGLLGTIVMAVVGCIMNYFVMMPLYAKVYGMPIEVFIEMGTVINSRVTDLYTFVLWMIGPFNIVKGSIMTVVALPLFKKIEKLLVK